MKCLYRNLLPFEFRFFLRSLFRGKYYARYFPVHRNKETNEITHELCFMMKEPTQLAFGLIIDFKYIGFRIEFLWFRVSIGPYEDLPF